MQETWVGEIPWRKKWPPTPVSLPGKSHGLRSLVGCSSWGCKESGAAEQHSLLTLKLRKVKCYNEFLWARNGTLPNYYWLSFYLIYCIILMSIKYMNKSVHNSCATSIIQPYFLLSLKFLKCKMEIFRILNLMPKTWIYLKYYIKYKT